MTDEEKTGETNKVSEGNKYSELIAQRDAARSRQRDLDQLAFFARAAMEVVPFTRHGYSEDDIDHFAPGQREHINERFAQKCFAIAEVMLKELKKRQSNIERNLPS